jgi:O-antigen/teichoic acid export membrane protein
MDTSKKRLAFNMIMQIAAFVANILVSFFLTSFVVGRLGAEVYGFVGFANNLTGYLSIFTVVINGLLNRFFTIELSQGNKSEAEKYYSSVTLVNLIITVALIAPAVMISFHIDRFFNVPLAYTNDIRLLFFLIILSFLFSLTGSSLGVATYSTNRLDLASILSMVTTLFRALLLFALFSVFQTHIWYMGMASIASSLLMIFVRTRYMKKLLPSVRFNPHMFDWSAVKNLVFGGIWNSVNQLSLILLTGLDLMIANLTVGAEAMGLLSVAKTIPTQINGLYAMISNTFAPKMTMLYGVGDTDGLLKETSLAMRLSGMFGAIPCVGLIVFGSSFYRLWLPTLSDDSIYRIQVMSILTLLPFIFGSFVFPLYTINTITLKLKIPTLLSVSIGLASTILVLVLVRTTSLGVYAIAGTSSALVLLRVLFFVPIYAAWNLSLKKRTFYPYLFRGIICVGSLWIVFSVVLFFVNISSWISLFLSAAFCALIGIGICLLTLFTHSETVRLVSGVIVRMRIISCKS